MFERFTEDARKAMFHARASAAARNARGIEPEDVLHGILVAAPSAVARFAGDAAASVSVASDATTAEGEKTELREATLREAQEAIRRHDSLGIPFSTSVRNALTWAAQEADALGHRTIRPEHLVLGLLRDEGTQAWLTLDEAGLGLRDVQRILREESEAAATTERQSAMTPVERAEPFPGLTRGNAWLRPVAAGSIALLSGAALWIGIRRAWRSIGTGTDRPRDS